MAATQFSSDYAQRVYAGVLGKIIGVFLGRPFEGWTYQKIMEELGEIRYYVNDVRKAPLIVADDDISGTFVFLRALEDHGYPQDITAAQIGETWLNYLVEGRTVLWWGGMGMSTEHTAYLRLKQGIPAPRSGSIETNGTTVAEQIGAQIFIDGWGLISPGNPAQAARFARAAGSVSHDGEAIYGAQVVAALIALAFVEKDIHKMLDGALAQIPANCLIARVIADIRAWVKQDGDWRVTRQRIEDQYGYSKFPGNCHMIPNHALIILALLYAPDDFSQALTIVNTSGWDTDCNSGNLGCIMGVRVGLDAINRKHDWISPVADRILVPTAEGGTCISDAGAEAVRILQAAYRLAGQVYAQPKDGVRYHFAFPRSVQGFLPILTNLGTPTAHVSNATWPFDPQQRCLQIRTTDVGAAAVAGAYVNTFLQPEELAQGGYGLFGSPQVYAGQRVSARLSVDAAVPGLRARLAIVHYGEDDKPQTLHGDWQPLAAGTTGEVAWTVPDAQGQPIYQLRLEFQGPAATVSVDRIAITGTPDTFLFATSTKYVYRWSPGKPWQRAWIDGVSRQCLDSSLGGQGLTAIQNEGTGVLAIGTSQWRDYRFEVTAQPTVAEAYGVAVAYRGLTRQVRLMIERTGAVRLLELDHAKVGELACGQTNAKFNEKQELAIEWAGATVRCAINGV